MLAMGFSNESRDNFDESRLKQLISELDRLFIKERIIMEDDKKLDENTRQEKRLFDLGMEFLNALERLDTDFVKSYLSSGLDANFQHPITKRTALHSAAISSRSYTRMLVNSGKCNYLIVDADGDTPFAVANKYGDDEAIYRLLFKKANQEAKNKGYDSLLDFIQQEPR